MVAQQAVGSGQRATDLAHEEIMRMRRGPHNLDHKIVRRTPSIRRWNITTSVWLCEPLVIDDKHAERAVSTWLLPASYCSVSSRVSGPMGKRTIVSPTRASTP